MKMNEMSGLIHVYNIDGSQEATVVDFIGSKGSKQVWRDSHTK